MVVAVLGASPKPERYSNKAIRQLVKHGHKVIPVAYHHKKIEGLSVVETLEALPKPIDTLTVYVGVERLDPLIPSIVNLKPKRVILNPGTESEKLMQALKKNNIAYEEACTLVMLSTG